MFWIRSLLEEVDIDSVMTFFHSFYKCWSLHKTFLENFCSKSSIGSWTLWIPIVKITKWHANIVNGTTENTKLIQSDFVNTKYYFLPGNHKVCESNKLKLRIWKRSLKKWTQARIQRPVEVILKAPRRIWNFICWSALGAKKRVVKPFVLCCENQKPNSQELMQTLHDIKQPGYWISTKDVYPYVVCTFIRKTHQKPVYDQVESMLICWDFFFSQPKILKTYFMQDWREKKASLNSSFWW